MKKLILILLILTATTASAAASHDDKHAMNMMMNCPMKIGGVEVAATDIPDGVALTFSTTTGDVAELRRRVEHIENMAEMPAMKSGMTMMHVRLIPGSANYEEVSDGARLTLMPKDPAQLDAFRTQVRERVEMMKNGDCSKMQDMMKDMMKEKAEPSHDSHNH